VCTAILCFRHLSLISENSSWFDGTFLFMFLFSYRGGKSTSAHNK
jgi:hypothetical protein